MAGELPTRLTIWRVAPISMLTGSGVGYHYLQPQPLSRHSSRFLFLVPRMPEGPSIIILKELVAEFKGKKITAVAGNSKAGIDRALGKKIVDFKSWGKHFLICLPELTIKIHFLLFGSYRINEERATPPRLSLQFRNGVINFYACSVKILEDDLDTIYDWSADVMSDQWNADAAKTKLQNKPETLVCDCLLDQDIFAGSGNIIKNEVLFRIRVHPLSRTGALSTRKLNELIREVRAYSFDFLKWKKAFVLRKHWLVHTKRMCPRCEVPLVHQHLGKYQRRTFFCTKCQKLYLVTQPTKCDPRGRTKRSRPAN